jgi:short-subunit dehydrogenase
MCVQADVSKTVDCQNLIDQTVQRFGRIDTLVCNAGYGIYRTVAQTSLQETRRIFETNVFGTTDCVHFALPVISRQEPTESGWRGQIMIVSSIVARRGVPYIGMYSATKAAQLAMAEALRVELKPMRIAVTTVHPISTKTEFGQVAEQMGDMVLPPAPMAQTVDVVAKKMLRAIERPRPEVWPSGPSRWIVGFGTLMPRLVDRAASKFRKQVEKANQPPMNADERR